MASAVVGLKRSFATMSEDNESRLSLPQEAGTSALVSHLRHTLSAEGTPSIPSSRQSTPRDTPVPAPTLRYHRRDFKPDASIVLIGMRGTGKSTLAVIASIACRRRVVDIDDLFQEATGFSTARYRKQFGASNHNLRQEELLQTTLRLHDQGAIIVCNGGSLERNGQMLMQEFAKTHPVVHILRDLQSIHEYLGGVELRRLKDMLAFTAPILRRCSNYEFYNIAETGAVHASSPRSPQAAPAFLTLKRAQRTFLKFLSLITSGKNASRPVGIPPLEPGYPLSDVATELRKYTCAVQVSLSDILAEDANIQSLEYGADAFEIVVDGSQQSAKPGELEQNLADQISVCMSKVRRSTVVPVILHILRPNTNNERTQYLECLKHGLRTAPEFIVVDLSLGEEVVAEVIAVKGISRVVGLLHADASWDDTFWIEQYEMAVQVGCALVRFSRPAEAVDDDYFLHKLRHNINSRGNSIPVTCYNSGKAGRRSVCFSQYLTPVIPPAAKRASTFPARLRTNPQLPWITAKEVTQALYASFTFDPMQVYIIGASLGYSVSPAMHNAAYACCGMPHRFNMVQSSSLNSLKELVRESNFGGSIVIQPYKVEVISLTDSLSQHARAIGAVNTLIPVRQLNGEKSIPTDLELFQERNQSGPVQALYGDNTEWIGIRSCVRRGLTPANAVRPSSCALVIGAGGMARAAVYALLQLGVKNVVIWNRTLEKAENLVAHFTRLVASTSESSSAPYMRLQGSEPNFHVLKTRDEDWPESFRQPTIVLSCIPADPIDGGPAAQFTLPQSWMRSPTGGVVMEIAYKTLNTPLMQQVRSEGSMWTYLDGLDFLPEQAFAQFELFTGKRAPRRVMREEVLRAWRDDQGNADPDMVERRLKLIDDQEP
ncbi:type I 3-dehydroquinase-domain-containing protein [Paraphoma chrysanthemicola]|uniref:Type I 3-dehydroquinase-domain-containing protein n=1 Tax=Paraphoma chrysanthemicola TaxID=798071 RepID=A0A8K0R6P5_9PLEO|nr:type I 3-dehydroquinase-domain-containing protein [Paraphoma chrysanthemicola]